MIAMLARLRASERGATLVETALALPIVLLLGLGGLEACHYVLAVLKVNQIAYAVADNAGRVRQALDETDINEIMIGAKLMGGTDFAANGRVILSDLEQRTNTSGSGGTGAITAANPNGYRQWIRWQRCAGALSRTSSYGLPKDASGNAVVNLDSTTNTDHGAVQTASTIDGMGPAAQQISSSGGTAVMVVEVFYAYKPLVPLYAYGASTLRVFEAFNIRQRTDFTVYNASNLSGNARSDCRLFNSAVPAA
ncbi:TadE/TadG family type IV pilus assembly protein [Sphingomonas sp. BIUV-7]|uniref:TadE/TadG family type IV pilus assembly protein n=1 Tax=Sphingomonas natans TaxID=3063330 RepID=A0ABT8Y8N2_9SPHN|nr:TadE/TadG family type IV pilus assembly protein [Sphingomonas sp. BIUV-7]MDO6414679.1 TadE/TadG family type IV pilus assembly protein [Sphingomonas sp. BIUV-7]